MDTTTTTSPVAVGLNKLGCKIWEAASNDDARPNLGHVFLRRDGTAEASDGHIMARVKGYADARDADDATDLAIPAQQYGAVVQAAKFNGTAALKIERTGSESPTLTAFLGRGLESTVRTDQHIESPNFDNVWPKDGLFDLSFGLDVVLLVKLAKAIGAWSPGEACVRLDLAPETTDGTMRVLSAIKVTPLGGLCGDTGEGIIMPVKVDG